ncbi:MAG: glycosyltransferase [Armatimonadota bacterium]|nr:glycosyltransferase [Armatimonadota bacterium]
MRVCHIITRLNVGGPARVLAALVPRLSRLGIDQAVIHGTEGPGEGRLPLDGVATFHLPRLQRAVRPLADARAAWELLRLLRHIRPDVVHTRMAKAGALGRLAAGLVPVPVVVHTFHGHVLKGYFSPPAERALVGIERALARWSDTLVAVSDRVRDELVTLGLGTAQRWQVIPDGYELDPLASSRLPAVEARRRLGLPERGPIVGIAGRLVPIKDHRTFLAVAVQVADAEPSATFVVAGDGPQRTMLEAEVRSGLRDRVRFLGWCGDIEALYRALDVIVLTSRNEGTPAALIEAAAAGVPAVATGVGGVPEVVLDGETGFLVPPGAPQAAVRRIIELLRAPSSRARMGERARAHVLERFGADRCAAAHAALYERLLASRRTDGPGVGGRRG